ncbi:pyridoxine/pyridoxamine 5'-phosphate oxidase [Skeletonema marinoi]|uniref:NAD(P)H-hydrate epimerase n=1 Tax=Skeletonema marinoi TaxID=267567 RepID=A0AAD9DBT7_9STRA|nr:pyridoxine/pyridoxamine 5'-phosphate oxidase [Skeletonema marinoi]
MTMMFRHINRLLSLGTLSSAAAFTGNSSRRHIINTQSLVAALATSTTPSQRNLASSTSLAMTSSFDTGYLNAQDATDLDVELMSTPGFSLEQLMELAGLSVAEAVYEVGTDGNDGAKKKRVLLVCGPGNNGGDGLVAARHLFHFGFQPTVVYPKRSTKPHFINLVQQLDDLNIPILDEIPATVATDNDDDGENKDHYDIIVDAIFGFSFRGTAPREPFATAITQMITMQTQQSSLLISVDVPSSWNVDGGDMTEGLKFQPDVLVSLTAPKLSAKKFTRRHFVGGRFLPPGLAEKYGIRMPPYPGVSQVMELSKPKEAPSKEEVDDGEMDWALQYQAYLDEQEKERGESDTEDDEGEEDEVEGEEWAKEYAAYCAEKEKEFFEANKPKE